MRQVKRHHGINRFGEQIKFYRVCFDRGNSTDGLTAAENFDAVRYYFNLINNHVLFLACNLCL